MPATSISCYVCNATDSNSPFQCGEWFERYDLPDIQPQDCSNVYGAKYCIKHIGRFEGKPNDREKETNDQNNATIHSMIDSILLLL